jgi:hypothetical protein
MNSNDMSKRCNAMNPVLWDEVEAEKLLVSAASAIEKVAGPNWNRDSIRTEPITKAIFNDFGLMPGGGTALPAGVKK